MLEFEHLVQVNDPNNANLTLISREELWQGLVLRARNPQKFNHSLECTAKTLGHNEFLRTIKVGNSRFCEHVVLYPDQKICTSTIAEIDQIIAQSMTCIEEPESGFLFVRFSYERELEESNQEVDIGEHLKSAYVQADRDAIAMIRMLAESKLFEQTSN